MVSSESPNPGDSIPCGTRGELCCHEQENARPPAGVPLASFPNGEFNQSGRGTATVLKRRPHPHERDRQISHHEVPFDAQLVIVEPLKCRTPARISGAPLRVTSL